MTRGFLTAGLVVAYSNQDIEALTAVLARIARPVHPEKTVEELEALLKRIRTNPVERVPTPSRSHRIDARLEPEQLDAIFDAYAAGDSATAVAAAFGVSESSVKRLVRQRGGEIRLQPLPRNLIAKAAALYESGMSVQAVADELRVPKSTLLRTLKKHGVQMRLPFSDAVGESLTERATIRPPASRV